MFLKRISFFVGLVFLLESGEKHIIGVRETGLFSNFLAVLSHLDYCKRTNKIPVVYWDSVSFYYESSGWMGKNNVWEYYFEPVSSATYSQGDIIDRRYFDPEGKGFPEYCDPQDKYRVWGFNLIQEYIRVRRYIREKVDKFIKQYFDKKYVIGLHLRGTDKKFEIAQTNIDELFLCANQAADNVKDTEVAFFVATDEQALLDVAKKKLNRPVIYYDSQRSNNSIPLHHRNLVISKAQAGEEVLIEVLLLARTNFFVHTSSNVSSAVLLFNVHLEHKLFGKTGR